MHLACSGLRDSLAHNATFVVPTHVLAAAAREDVSRFRLQEGLSSWERPAIYTIDAWLERCWHEVRYDSGGIPALLSPAQELLVWRKLIEQDHADLFDLDACARGARDASRTIAQWCISWDTPSAEEQWSGHQDGNQFRQWLRQFKEICAKNDWMSRAHLWPRVPDWFAKGKLPRQQVVLLGFDDWPPALEAIRQASGARKLDWDPPTSSKTGRSQSSYNDTAQEIQAAARWARRAWVLHPGSSIAVFVPDLSEQRSLVARTFHNIFYPASALNGGADPRECIFHIGAAAPLDSQPLIAAALLFLALADARLETSQAGAILRSPYLKGAAAERSLRAFADVDLRRRREMDVSFGDVLSASRQCPILASTVWPSLARLLNQRRATAELGDWSRFVSDLLRALGWPGDNLLDEQEQALLDSWKDALSGLATLGMVAGSASYDVALDHLRRLLRAPGPATGDWSSPIQILDSSDAAGLSFDHACVTGLSEETWPPRERLSPFIPMSVQRPHGIPASGRERAREVARRRTRVLFQSAPNLNISFCGRLAPIAAQFSAKNLAPSELWTGKLPIDTFEPAQLECIEDSFGPRFISPSLFPGGASVLKAQSACAFQAFSKYRLDARAPEDACFGLDASTRGILMHKVLELVWREIKSRDHLRTLTEEELVSVVQSAVDQAVPIREDFGAFQGQARSAERDRLTTLVLGWLAIESQRQHPFTIETMEQDRTCEVAGLRLSLRMDRIDRLDNGKLVLIDYKSGAQDRKKLDGDRPPEPQLLLYATTLGDGVEGVYFAQLKPRSLCPIGYSQHGQFSLDKKEVLGPDWTARLADWRETVDRLARDFVDGYAHIHPAKDACTFCQSRPLCRVGEQVSDD